MGSSSPNWRRFPALKIDANALYIRDGKYYTSAGITAWIDLSWH